MIYLLTGVTAVVCAYFSLSAWRRKWIIDDTPTSTCRGVFVGRNEVVGRARPLYDPLTAPFSQRPVVWFRWDLERYQKSGDNHQWVTVEQRSTAAPFWIQDQTGRVLVRPRRAEVHPQTTLCERLDRDFAPPYSRWQLRQWVLVGEDVTERNISLADSSFLEAPGGGGFLSFTSDTASPISALSGRHRITEQVIAVDDPLYLLGTARPRRDGPGLEFTGDDDDDLLVSTKTEAKVASTAKWTARGTALGCFVATAWFMAEASNSATGRVRLSWILGAVGAEVLVLFLLALVRNYNRQVEVKEQAAKAWSLIDISLQRRMELIPHLVGVVQAYGQHERQVQELVTELRAVPEPPPATELPDDAALAGAESSDRRLRSAARTTVAVAEAYPDLKADQLYLDLQKRYADAEEGVASARTFYNDAIELLRTRRTQFPGSIFARYVQVPSWKLFEADEAALIVPMIAQAPVAAPAPEATPAPGSTPPAVPPATGGPGASGSAF